MEIGQAFFRYIRPRLGRVTEHRSPWDHGDPEMTELTTAFSELEIPVEDFKLPGCAGFRRSFQGIPELLVRAGIETIDELNRFNGMTDSELLAIKGIGPRTLSDIRQVAANLAGNPYHSWEGSPWWQGMPSERHCDVHGTRLVYSESAGVFFGYPVDPIRGTYAHFDRRLDELLPNRNVPRHGGGCLVRYVPPLEITEMCMSCDDRSKEWSEIFHLGGESGLWEKMRESEEAQNSAWLRRRASYREQERIKEQMGRHERENSLAASRHRQSPLEWLLGHLFLSRYTLFLFSVLIMITGIIIENDYMNFSIFGILIGLLIINAKVD